MSTPPRIIVRRAGNLFSTLPLTSPNLCISSTRAAVLEPSEVYITIHGQNVRTLTAEERAALATKDRGTADGIRDEIDALSAKIVDGVVRLESVRDQLPASKRDDPKAFWAIPVSEGRTLFVTLKRFDNAWWLTSAVALKGNGVKYPTISYRPCWLDPIPKAA